MPASSTRTPQLDDLFGSLSLRNFIDEFLHRLPIALPNTASAIRTWGSWETIAEILGAENADVMAARANQRWAGPPPGNLHEALKLSNEGYTILIRHAEQHHEGIAALAEQFASVFQGPSNAHLYATPPNQFGFSWHYDAEDVFIFQLSGAKEYELRKNSVNPWPVEETLPADMQYEREFLPLLRVMMHPGDMLYIPCGYWHRGVAHNSTETAISLALGVMSRSAMDVYDQLRPHLLESMRWRQRLPIVGNSDDNPQANDLDYAELLKELAADITRLMTSDGFRQEIMNQRPESAN